MNEETERKLSTTRANKRWGNEESNNSKRQTSVAGTYQSWYIPAAPTKKNIKELIDRQELIDRLVYTYKHVNVCVQFHHVNCTMEYGPVSYS